MPSLCAIAYPGFELLQSGRRFRLGFLWLTLKRLYVWLVKHESSLNRLTHLPGDLRFAAYAPCFANAAALRYRRHPLWIVGLGLFKFVVDLWLNLDPDELTLTV